MATLKQCAGKRWRVVGMGTSTPGEWCYGDSLTQYDVDVEFEGIGDKNLIVNQEQYQAFDALFVEDENHWHPAELLPLPDLTEYCNLDEIEGSDEPPAECPVCGNVFELNSGTYCPANGEAVCSDECSKKLSGEL